MRQRLYQRWDTLLRFARTGLHRRDKLALALAGIARHRPFGGSSLYARTGRFLSRNMMPRIKCAAGLRLRLDPTDLVDLMVYEEIFVEGIYPLDVVKFTPELILDCGACRGMFSVLAHAYFPNAGIVAFEPEPDNFKRLQHNLALNQIDTESIAAAAGTAPGRTRFSGTGFGGRILGKEEDGGYEVVVASLPALLEQRRPQSLVLKMDIEGAEKDILPSLASLLPPKTVIFLETHHDEATCANYLRPLIEAGFSHELIRKRHLESDDDIDFVERLLMRPPNTGPASA